MLGTWLRYQGHFAGCVPVFDPRLAGLDVAARNMHRTASGEFGIASRKALDWNGRKALNQAGQNALGRTGQGTFDLGPPHPCQLEAMPR